MNLKALLENKKLEVLSKPKSKITNERQLVLKDFLDQINPPRIASGYPPLPPARLGMLLRYMDTQQLKTFYGECKFAANFSKCFWWRLNPDNYTLDKK